MRNITGDCYFTEGQEYGTNNTIQNYTLNITVTEKIPTGECKSAFNCFFLFDAKLSDVNYL